MTTTQTRSTPPTDDDLRALLAPLAAAEPTHADRAALRRAAADERLPQRRPALTSGRAVFAVAATTAAVGVGFAVLPGADHPGASGREGAAAFLRATAAVADDAPAPSAVTGAFRYTKLRETFIDSVQDGDRTAARHDEQVLENWVGAGWSGRTVAAAGRTWTTGDDALAAAKIPFGTGDSPIDHPRDTAYAYGDGPLAGLDPASLPHDRDGIAAAVRKLMADYGSHAKPGLSTDSLTTYSIINLLVTARLTPDQRAALLDVLSTDPNAQDLGTVKDGEGRSGHGITLSYGGAQQLGGDGTFRIVFDADSAEVLEWSEEPQAPSGPDGPARTETVLASGYTGAVGDRP